MRYEIAHKDLPSRGRSYKQNQKIEVSPIPFLELIQISKVEINSLSDAVSVYSNFIHLTDIILDNLEVIDLVVIISIITTLSDSHYGFNPNIKCKHLVPNPDLDYYAEIIAKESNEELKKAYLDKMETLPEKRVCDTLITTPITVDQFKYTQLKIDKPFIKYENEHTGVCENLYPPTVSRLLLLEQYDIEPDDLVYPIMLATRGLIPSQLKKFRSLLKEDFINITNKIADFQVDLLPFKIVCPSCGNTMEVIFHLNQVKGYL